MTILGDRPLLSLFYIDQFGLFNIVFAHPEAKDFTKEDIHTGLDRVKHLMRLLPLSQFTIDKEQKMLAVLSCVLAYLYKHSYTTKKSKTFPVIMYILKESIKYKNEHYDYIMNVLDAAHKFRNFFFENNRIDSRVKLGYIIRECKEAWRLALLLAEILSLPPYCKYHDDINKLQEYTYNNAEGIEISRKYKEFREFIDSLELDYAWTITPDLDGDQIMAEFKIAGGPLVREILQAQIEFKLQNPKATGLECLVWLKSKFAHTDVESIEPTPKKHKTNNKKTT